jgi:hypothetical protein
VGRRKLFDVAYIIGAVAANLVLTTQSGAPSRGLPALLAVFVCFAELSRRKEAEIGQGHVEYVTPQAGFLFVTCLMLVFVCEPLLVNSFALFESWRKSTSISPLPGLPPRLSGFLVAPVKSLALHDVLGHEDAAHATLAELRRKSGAELVAEGELRPADYLSTIIEGVTLLGGVASRGQSVVVFDMADPFTFALGLTPTRYGYPMFFAGANFRSIHPPAELVFSNADFVMVPVLPDLQSHLDLMIEIYGSYLKANFEERAKSPHWHLWARRLGSAAAAGLGTKIQFTTTNPAIQIEEAAPRRL